MALTLEEKASIRHHLGYPNTSPSNAMVLGSVVPMQALFLLDSNMDKVLPENEERIRRYICILDNIECQMADAINDLQVLRTAGGTELDNKVNQNLEGEYRRFAGRLADDLAVTYYPFAERFQGSPEGFVTTTRRTIS